MTPIFLEFYKFAISKFHKTKTIVLYNVCIQRGLYSIPELCGDDFCLKESEKLTKNANMPPILHSYFEMQNSYQPTLGTTRASGHKTRLDQKYAESTQLRLGLLKDIF